VTRGKMLKLRLNDLSKYPAGLPRSASDEFLRSRWVFTPTESLESKPGVFRSWKIPALIVGGVIFWFLVSYLSHHLLWLG